MRKRTRTITVTIETERRVEARRATGGEFVGYCHECGAEIVMVEAEEAGRIGEVSTCTTYHRIEADKVHFAERPEGSGRSKRNRPNSKKWFIRLLTTGLARILRSGNDS